MILKAEKVTRQFNRVSGSSNIFFAVHETDFELPGGLLTVLEGRSGSGKTTFLSMLSGLLRPSSGNTYLDGADIYAQTDKELSRFRNDNFGIVPQGQTAIATLTVMENVMLPGTIYGLDEGLREKAEKLLDRMGILDLADVLPKELSGGEIRRMAIARALIRDPKVIFADEPTSDLDDANTDIVFDILKSIAADGKAVLVVTHERNADKYADRMYRMDAGVLMEC